MALQMTEKADKDSTPFDLILSDLNMTQMNGFEFLKAIRRHQSLGIQRIKFIMITTKPQNVLRAIDLGANQCLHKPFDQEALGLRVVWALGNQWEGENHILPANQPTDNIEF
jgi:CheY-like chemotaxis protein